MHWEPENMRICVKRLKEQLPANIGEFRVPLGIPEVIREGTDVTLVTYGSCVRIALEAVDQLKDFGISVELIDVQSLLPFMMQKVMEEQGGYRYLDAEPLTLTGNDHRPAYSNDGDYFSNPNAENVFETVYSLMHEYNPNKYPQLF